MTKTKKYYKKKLYGKRSKKSKSDEKNEKLLENVIQLLESEIVPWRKEMSYELCRTSPYNALTKQTYSGVNDYLLKYHLLMNERAIPIFCTFLQMKDLSKKLNNKVLLNAGSKSISLLFYESKYGSDDEEDDDEDEDNTPLINNNTKIKRERKIVTKWSDVFHISDITGLDSLKEKYINNIRRNLWNTNHIVLPILEIIKEVENIKITHSNEKQLIDEKTKTIYTNSIEYSRSDDHYYCYTLYGCCYFLVDKFTSNWKKPLKDVEKSLASELTCCLLCDKLNIKKIASIIFYDTQHWLYHLKQNPKLYIMIVTLSCKIMDYIISLYNQNYKTKRQLYTCLIFDRISFCKSPLDCQCFENINKEENHQKQFINHQILHLPKEIKKLIFSMAFPTLSLLPESETSKKVIEIAKNNTTIKPKTKKRKQ